MASSPNFATHRRRRRPPMSGAFFTPSHLSDVSLIQTLASISGDLVASYSAAQIPFQKSNTRSLLRKLGILLTLFQSLQESPPSALHLPSSASVCLKELYILIYRSRLLLDYCFQSSRLWLVLHNPQISGHFHDLTQDIATLLDVFPLDGGGLSLSLSADVREQVELLRRQCRKSKLYIDPRDEALRLRLFSFLDELEKGRAPDAVDLEEAFFGRLGIRDARTCRAEIESLEEQIYSQEEAAAADPSVLGAVVALTRYCRFLLFGFLEEEEGMEEKRDSSSRRGVRLSIGEASVAVPKDFCCPITLDLMRDPVIVSTGQTYDRASITQWMDEGHSTCPNSGQLLAHTRLVPNRALRSLISEWCAAQGIHYDSDSLEGSDASADSIATASAGLAAVEANRSTAEILVRKLSDGQEDEKTVAARELRLLAKTGKENRAFIAEAGAIPLLRKLLRSANPVAQENSVTAILNLSIHERNKSRIMEEEGCLTSIVDVLRHGRTTEARENAAAALFSLSAVHEYKKMITGEPGAVEALAGLLRDGSQRGRKDAVTALFNLSTHPDCCARMVESGAVSALVGAAAAEGVAEEAAGALALLVRQQIAAEVVGGDDEAVGSLMGLMRRGSPKAKENAVAALHELCKSGGVALTQRVARTPSLGGLIQALLFTGTKRARRKAASLARMCQRCELAAAAAASASAVPFGGGGGWSLEYSIARSSSVRRSASLVGGDVSSVSVQVAISVPVL